MEFIDLVAQQARIREDINARIAEVLDRGQYIMGPEVHELEDKLAAFCGAKYCISCANGTDALQLALMALNVRAGDAVFVPSFTFAATAEIVPPTGATPIFVDVCEDSYNLDVQSFQRAIEYARSINLRPACVIPVDLFGLPADYDTIEEVAKQERMAIIADSAQGFGATYRGRKTGAIGDIATTSFFPAKPLGCYGDGGALFTDDEDIARLIRSYRIHGKGSHKYDNERIGINSRLDTLQAAILLAKLEIYQDEIDARQEVAKRYESGLANVLHTPKVPVGSKSVWAQYTIRPRNGRDRNTEIQRLTAAGVPTAIYYPHPLHQQTAYRNFPGDPNGLVVSERLSQEVFSLPMHPYLDVDTQEQIIAVIARDSGS